MDYKPYSPEWVRKRELKSILYEYLEDTSTEPSQICEDLRDILDEWVGSYSSRAEKGQQLRNFFK